MRAGAEFIFGPWHNGRKKQKEGGGSGGYFALLIGGYFLRKIISNVPLLSFSPEYKSRNGNRNGA